MNFCKVLSCFFLIFLTNSKFLKSQPSDTAVINQLFEVVFFHDFENDTPGEYRLTEWKRDWNNPKWANKSIGLGKIIDEKSSKYLQIKLPKGEMGLDSSGVQWPVKFNQAYDELYLSYRIKFSKGFKSDNIHGKLPGLGGGALSNPGVVPTGTDRWSVRYMFHGTNLFFYIYYPDMNQDFGDKVPVQGKKYYGAGVNLSPGYTLQPEVWYTVTQRVVLNTVGKNDGFVEGYVNERFSAQKINMRFRDIPTLRIERINFANFLGASGKYLTEDEHISFDDIYVFTYKPWVNVPRGNIRSAADRKLLLPDLNLLKAWSNTIRLSKNPSNSNILSWNNFPIKIEGYIVERREEDQTEFSRIATIGAEQTNFEDANRTGRRNYVYRIRAFKNPEFSYDSREIFDINNSKEKQQGSN